METLLAVIVTWLSATMGLPAIYEHPSVELATPTRMAEVRYSRIAAKPTDGGEAEARLQPREVADEVHAFYDDASRTIYLPSDWSGAVPADVALLVHEVVHHLQNMAGMTFACPGERERDAYAAQAAWLELFDRRIEEDFGIDPLTILVRTKCWF